MGLLGSEEPQQMRDDSPPINDAIRLVAKTAPTAVFRDREEPHERNRYLKQNAVIRDHLLSLHINTEIIEDGGENSSSYTVSSLAVVWWGETLKEIEAEADSQEAAAKAKEVLSSRLHSYAESLGIKVEEFAIQETPWDKERGIGTWAEVKPMNAPMVRILKSHGNKD